MNVKILWSPQYNNVNNITIVEGGGVPLPFTTNGDLCIDFDYS